MNLLKKTLLAVGLIVPQPTLAASIHVVSHADDNVGRQVAYNLREAISQSSRHKIVYNEHDADFGIVIVTVQNPDSVATAYGAVLTMRPLGRKGMDVYLNSIAGTCGSARVRECGQNILGAFDEEINKWADLRSVIQQARQ